MKRHRAFFHFTAFLFVFHCTIHAQEVLDGIAAVVNQDVITFSQVRELVGTQEQAARETLVGTDLTEKIKAIRLEAINDLIDNQLILQHFKEQKFQLPNHLIEDRIQAVVREEFGGDRSAFIRTLSAQGFTMDRFRQMQTDKMIVGAMRTQMVKSDVLMPESKILEYYRKNSQQFTTDEQVKLRMIVVRKSEGDSGSRRKLIDEVRRKIAGGAPFPDMARMYSDDSTQAEGGDWGWITRTTLNESLTRIAFGLKTGVVSPVIDLGSSFYLMYVEARRNGNTKPLKEVHDEIQKRLIIEERERRQQEWIAKLRKKAFIKIY